MEPGQRLKAFVHLGAVAGTLADNDEWQGFASGVEPTEFERFQNLMLQVERQNPWFTQSNIRSSLRGIAHMCQPENLKTWLSSYSIPNMTQPKTIALILAGNIPLVGFHDFMCVLLSGNRALVKLSGQDTVLLPALAEILFRIEPGFMPLVQFSREGKLPAFDAVIATGSNNTARYFDHYFGKYPHIIRKNRSSVALLDGSETEKELHDLGQDIFLYFGLGCRNVSKLYLPQDFDPDRLFGALLEFSQVSTHNKYINNYDYHKALWLLNSEQLLDNGFLLLKPDQRLVSPVGSLFYERYESKSAVESMLAANEEVLQCVVGHGHVEFGSAQFPKPWDYADRVDTMAFLLNL